MKMMMQRGSLAMGLAWTLGNVLACGVGADPNPDTEVLTDDASALSQPFGGLDESDAPPYFGDPQFAAVEEYGDDPVASDATTPDDAMQPRIAFVAVWGKLKTAPNAPATIWDGGLTIKGGTIGRVRTLAFDPEDRLLARTSSDTIEWTSRTTTHHDGISTVLRIPDMRYPEYLGGSVMIKAGEFKVRLPLSKLMHYSKIFEVGENKVSIMAFVFRPGDCQTGAMSGSLQPPSVFGVGKFLGRLKRFDGSTASVMQGFYGRSTEGKGTLVGRLTRASDGKFRARIVGQYADGKLAGVLVGKGNVQRGTFVGRYTDAMTAWGQPIAGEFHGRWTMCPRVDQPTTMPEVEVVSPALPVPPSQQDIDLGDDRL